VPLQPGKSGAARSANIAEILKKYKRTGRIGTSTPKSDAAAARQAAAIANRKSRGG
jgi:hypothetical protein